MFSKVCFIFVNGERIMYEIFRQLLQERGVSTYRVAVATGIPQSTFTAWKNGTSTPKTDKMQKIADFFHVPIGYLYGNSVSMPLDTETIAHDIDSFGKYLKDLGWDVQRVGKKTYELNDGQVSVRISEEKYHELEVKIRNECEDVILGFLAESLNSRFGKSISLAIAAHDNDTKLCDIGSDEDTFEKEIERKSD